MHSLPVTLFGCSLLMLCAGTLYTFSLWSDLLRHLHGYTQTQTQLIGAIGDWGLYFGLCVGAAYDRRIGRHPRTAVAGVVAIAIGYVILANAGVHSNGDEPMNTTATQAAMMLTSTSTSSQQLKGWIEGVDYTTKGVVEQSSDGSSDVSGGFWSFLTSALAFFLVGQGSVALYVTALDVAQRRAVERTRGRATGVVVSAFGVSAGMFSVLHALMGTAEDEGTELRRFLTTMAAITTALPLLSLLFLLPKTPLRHPSSTPSHPSSTPLSTPSGGEEHGIIASAYRTAVGLVRRASFRYLYVATMLAAGPGLVYINNMAQYLRSMTAVEDGAAVEVGSGVLVTFAVFNTAGRLIAGWLGDRYMRPRFLYSRLCAGMAIAQSLLAIVAGAVMTGTFSTATGTWIAAHVAPVLVGLAYGSLFAVWPVLLRELFGSDNYGSHFGIMNTSCGVAVAVFGPISGALYDARAEHQQPHNSADSDVLMCYGPECYLPVWIMGAVSAILASICAVRLSTASEAAYVRAPDGDNDFTVNNFDVELADKSSLHTGIDESFVIDDDDEEDDDDNDNFSDLNGDILSGPAGSPRDDYDRAEMHVPLTSGIREASDDVEASP